MPQQHEVLGRFNLEKTTLDISKTKIDQYTWFDKKTNERICSVQIFEWWDGLNIAGLEIEAQHRRKGLSYAVLDFAVDVLGARNLAVERCNVIAKHVYDKYGFTVVDEDKTYFYMSYGSIDHKTRDDGLDDDRR